MKIECETTIQYEQVVNNLNNRIQLYRGGSRSGKTFNISLALLTLGLQKPMVIDITRRTLPALKATVLKDFLYWVDQFGLRTKMDWNKTERTFKLNGSEWAYYSLDESEKVHGRKRDIIFVNELTEVPEEIIKQLLIRTIGTLIGDYNPAILPDHYINKLTAREDTIEFKSTYLDNIYLEEEIVKEIELLKHTDPYMWKIYGLGEMALPEGVIFRFDTIDTVPEDATFIGYGFDIGYADPSVLTALYTYKDMLIIDEVFYERHLTDPDIVARFDENEVSKRDYVVMDVDPGLRSLLSSAGYKVKQVKKGPGSVLKGIKNLKTIKIRIVKTAFNVVNEFSLYKWKQTRDGKVTDEPLHEFSHAPDSVNYAYRTLGRVASYAVR